MKTPWIRLMAALVGCVTVLSLAGCARDRDQALFEPFQTAYAPLPPEFLTGPIGRYLARQGDFSARVEVVGEPTVPNRPLTGQIFGRNRTLVFAPDPDRETRKKFPEEVFWFIWNTTTGSGYVVNEPLQGYAPVTFASLADTNSASDATLRISRGAKETGFPAEVATTNVTLKVSRLRLTPPEADLLVPPASFTRYPSPEQMAQELALRRHTLKRGGR